MLNKHVNATSQSFCPHCVSQVLFFCINANPTLFFFPGLTATVPTAATSDSTLDLSGNFLPDSFPEGVDPSQYALPVFLQEPKDTYTARGATATLTCSAAHALKAYFT